MACIFTVGEKFESFASLSEKIKQFELENYVPSCGKEMLEKLISTGNFKLVNWSNIGQI